MKNSKVNINYSWVKNILLKPSIIGLIASVNQGKSNTLYNIIEATKGKSLIYAFGLKNDIKGVINFSSIEELEQIKDSLIIVDEFFTLFDLDNRHNKKQIEEILRFINHNNNILVLAGLPENFKKFIGAKLDIVLFKKCFYGDFINGSNPKKIIDNFKDTGNIKGTTHLNLGVDELLIYNKSYKVVKVDYLKQYDTKKENKQIVSW